MKWTLLFVLVGEVAACGSDKDDDKPSTTSTKDYVGIDGARFCDMLLSCSNEADGGATLSRDDCLDAYGSLRVPAACKSKLDTATCASSSAEVFSLDCFPGCGSTTGTCDGNNLTTCNSGIQRLTTLSCPDLCAAKNLTFQSCGVSPEDGQTKCLCT